MGSPVDQPKIKRKNDPFWGFRTTEHKPQIGDMVCFWRGSEQITYENAAEYDSFKCHCDIVISKRDDHVSTIGGNIKDTVSRVNFPLDAKGYLLDTGRLICVAKNNL